MRENIEIWQKQKVHAKNIDTMRSMVMTKSSESFFQTVQPLNVLIDMLGRLGKGRKGLHGVEEVTFTSHHLKENLTVLPCSSSMCPLPSQTLFTRLDNQSPDGVSYTSYTKGGCESVHGR